jgi:two-component system, chemotaxis family, CheB/CheR fusion protein
LDLPIVAIGASAGGLEAISEFLMALPPQSAMAYVVIQHLDPEHKSLLPEILAKKTKMSVELIHDGLVVQANQVYVIPPNTALTLSEDRFQLTRRASEGPHHPVDVFFSSLAEARADAAIGVVLSGADSDGSLGVQQIKHNGGITFAQQPESAKFASMPQNAIDTGCVDFVLRPSAIAQELMRLGSHPYLRHLPSSPVDSPQIGEGADEADFKRVFRRLRSAHGVDFSNYKRSTLQRRLGRRMAVRKIDRLSDYVTALEDEPAELSALYQDFLIRVTRFFRDPESFDILSAHVFPRVCEGRSPNDPVRIWIPGCASGEEVYSIAIALVEYLGDRLPSVGIQIFGTDVSEVEIEKARAGRYLANIAEEVSGERLQRFFVKEDNHYRIAKSLRDLCIFARHDITRDPPFSRLDLVSCRNLLIYLGAAAQRRVMQVFHYSLRPQGFLLLGHSESVGSGDFFELIDKQQRLYSRKPIAPSVALALRQRGAGPEEYQNTATEIEAPFVEIDSAQREADRLLLAHYAPASLLVDEELTILQFRGETSPYIEHASGSSSLNLQRVVRPELIVEISPAIAEARETGSTVQRTGLTIDDRTDLVLKVIPLRASSAYQCYLIVLEDAAHRGLSRRRVQQPASATLSESEKDRRLAQLERDIAATREYMQSTIEEHEAVKEELKSAHEEVLSANEEFHSTNEELETAKEEMQATNEELIITNDELRNRNRELAVINGELRKAEAMSERARGFADAIVRTVREALLVLDEQMYILRANDAYYARFNTLPEETEGRLLQQALDGKFSAPELLERLAAVPNRNVALEDFEIAYSDPAAGPRVLRLNARKVPGDERRENLILLTMEDITLERMHSKQAEMEAQEHRNEVAHLLRVASIGELSAALSHELHQPLTAILANAQTAQHLLSEKFELDEMRSILSDIVADDRRASQVISGLHKLLKKREFELEKLDANDLIQEVLKLMNHELRARQIRVSRDLAPGLPAVLGDRVQLQQVLINLIFNANEAMSHQAEKTRKLTLKSHHEGGVVQISVADTGGGIPPGDEEKIFERYHTTKSQGLGLGLSLSRSILLAHGGRLWAENQEAGGAALHLTLPEWKDGANL